MPEYSIEGVSVKFPFDAYPCQIEFMAKVIRALNNKTHGLLESPTGTGKTLCLLCATLAWREHYMRTNAFYRPRVEVKYESPFPGVKSESGTRDREDEEGPSAPRIYYSSRTHSQLSQVVKELKRAGYNVRSAVIGSRDHLCLVDEVRKLPTSAAQARMCRRKVTTRSCAHYNATDRMKTDEGIYDIEEVVQYAQDRRACPFFVSRNSIKAADIIFLPYNYLIDPVNRKQQNLDLSDGIIIFDEAHNLESSCTDAVSVEFNEADLTACLDEIKTCIPLAAASKDAEPADFKMLYDSLETMALHFRTLEVPRTGYRIEPGRFLYDFFQQFQITQNSVPALLATLETGAELIVNDQSAHRRSRGALSKFNTLLSTVFRDALRLDYVGTMRAFKVHLCFEPIPAPPGGSTSGGAAGNRPTQQRVLHFWCFHSGIAMRDLVNQGVRTCILASGTLSPLDSFAQEMGVPFAETLENSHVIKPSQLFIGVAGRGPNGITLTSAFATRNSPEYHQDLGNAVTALMRIAPEGSLGFFPSYSVMDLLLGQWHHKGMMDLITRQKPVFVEPKDRRELNGIIDEFTDAAWTGQSNGTFQGTVNQNKGSLLFAVCRGKVSEGIDFADHRGRLVMVLGIPYPNAKDPRVELKRQFLDEMRSAGLGRLSGQDWYQQQAARAINQAVGRVIRHRHDYGAIMLLDERLGYANIRNQISKWLRPHVRSFNNFNDVLAPLAEFYRANQAELGRLVEQPDLQDMQRRKLDRNGIAGPGSRPEMRARALPEPPRNSAFSISRSMAAGGGGGRSVAGASASSSSSSTAVSGNMFSSLRETGASTAPKGSGLKRAHSATVAANPAPPPARGSAPSSSFSQPSANRFAPAPPAPAPAPPSAAQVNKKASIFSKYAAYTPTATPSAAASAVLGVNAAPQDGPGAAKRARLSVIDSCAQATRGTSAAGTSSTAPPVAPADMSLKRKPVADPAAFKDLVRAKLQSAHGEFQKILLGYKQKTISVTEMMDRTLALFATAKSADLFKGFTAFVPSEHKHAWLRMYTEHTDAAPTREFDLAACFVCRRGHDTPFDHRQCRHRLCYRCWFEPPGAQLRAACPVPGCTAAVVSRNSLRQIHFT
ncbi:hypothetical protein H9P43_003045 [Blastocladiella emersonii ATCC 22665]|nr:hypothetical protein H9P43_003045 [Blastocladiella emersonii ATCC 22665]